MNKLLVICGPTTTGKTALAIKLAKKFSTKGGPASGWHGEIVSADSRQVYRGMDIGTGKDIGNAKFKIPHFVKASRGKQNSKLNIENKNYQVGYYLFKKTPIWLLDVVRPDQKFSVAHWVKFANLVIKNIWKRKKLPIIVGGTGFWIKALINGVESLGIVPDWGLREKLSNCSIVKLSNWLKKIDPGRWQRMNKSDRKNPRRLIRAIEIAKKIKNLKLKMKNYLSTIDLSKTDNLKLKIDKLLIIGLKVENKILYERIDKRVEERVQAGVEKEIKDLLKTGYSFESSVLGTTIGYREWQPFLENLMSKEEIIQGWKFAEHAYARRQMIWFKKALRQAQGKHKKIKWFDIGKSGWQEDVVKLITNWYTDSNGED